jgi:predicted dinucleotide-binding enzyme
MNIAILGSGGVGRAHAGRLSELGHSVVVGTRDPDASVAKIGIDERGQELFGTWHASHTGIAVKTYAAAVEGAEVVLNALRGSASVEVLSALSGSLAGMIVVDIANPLYFAEDGPPTLFVCNDSSLGEQLQTALPGSHVVKAFSTMHAGVQIDPGSLGGDNHALLLCGNDAAAKQTVTEIATQYGWQEIIDLGDITAARGMEMILPLWIRTMSTLGTPAFNYTPLH